MKQTRWQIWVATAVIVTLSVVFTLPFLWMLSTSLKAPERIQTAYLDFVPRAPFAEIVGKETRIRPLMEKDGRQEVQIYDGNTLTTATAFVAPGAIRDRFHAHAANYSEGIAAFPFPQYLFNTLVICLLSVVGTVLSCSLVAYGLTCIEWRGRELLFWVMLSTMMLPAQVTMIPLFLTFKHLGWINTILPLVVPAFLGNAFFIFLLRQFYRSVPRDLVEAARIDGCGELGIWARVMVPLSQPALAMVALFTFIGAWNDFLGPLIYLMDEKKYTLSIGLAMYQNQYNSEWGQMMAMSLLMTVPVIVIFFFTQKTFIQGVKLSGIKG